MLAGKRLAEHCTARAVKRQQLEELQFHPGILLVLARALERRNANGPGIAQRRKSFGLRGQSRRMLDFQRLAKDLRLVPAHAAFMRASPRSRSAMRSSGSSSPICNRTSGPPVQGLALRLQYATTARLS